MELISQSSPGKKSEMVKSEIFKLWLVMAFCIKSIASSSEFIGEVCLDPAPSFIRHHSGKFLKTLNFSFRLSKESKSMVGGTVRLCLIQLYYVFNLSFEITISSYDGTKDGAVKMD